MEEKENIQDKRQCNKHSMGWEKKKKSKAQDKEKEEHQERRGYGCHPVCNSPVWFLI